MGLPQAARRRPRRHLCLCGRPRRRPPRCQPPLPSCAQQPLLQRPQISAGHNMRGWDGARVVWWNGWTASAGVGGRAAQRPPRAGRPFSRTPRTDKHHAPPTTSLLQDPPLGWRRAMPCRRHTRPPRRPPAAWLPAPRGPGHPPWWNASPGPATKWQTRPGPAAHAPLADGAPTSWKTGRPRSRRSSQGRGPRRQSRRLASGRLERGGVGGSVEGLGVGGAEPSRRATCAECPAPPTPRLPDLNPR